MNHLGDYDVIVIGAGHAGIEAAHAAATLGARTAVFTLSDTTGIAAMKALQDRGRRVPEDVSVIAIDGLRVSEYITPTLTTMVQPGEEMARESVRILLSILEDGAAARHVRLEATLREGASARQI